jgi:hypothetical protein
MGIRNLWFASHQLSRHLMATYASWEDSLWKRFLLQLTAANFFVIICREDWRKK